MRGIGTILKFLIHSRTSAVEGDSTPDVRD
jgi:hypothetical protein